MDFYSIFDEQSGSNEEKAKASHVNNETQQSASSASSVQNGVPVRWDFKALLKQEEMNNTNETASEDPVAETTASAVAETSGDPDFDREWAEMLAQEELNNQAKFISENQIASTDETKSESIPTSTVMPRMKSVAEIMRGFGNPGNDEEENNSEEQISSTLAVVEAETDSPEINAATVSVNIPAADSSNEITSETETPITNAIHSETETSAIPEIAIGQNEESSINPIAETAGTLSYDSTAVEFTNSTTTEIVTEPVSEMNDEMRAETVVGTISETDGGFPSDFAEQEEWNTIGQIEEPEARIIDEPVEQVAALMEEKGSAEVVSETEVTESAAVTEWTGEVTNEIMSESENTFLGETFEPIELASEPEIQNAVPVFVNVEHSWMYAEEEQQEPAEAISETDFENSLPGELPLFSSEAHDSSSMQTDTHTHNNKKSEEAMKFELPEYSSIIKVIGVGGGGSNAVNHMYKLGIKGVDFLVCNTDKQALDLSPVPHKIVLGTTLTEGRGAGSIPEVGRNAAIENIEDLRTVLSNNTKMVFITAGMGGGTGTGAAPVIAGVARELGILTVGIVTVPFAHEGKKRRQYAEEGIEMLKQNVDTLLVIRNDKLREMYGNLKLSDAFAHADDVLTTAAKSIAEIISITQQINVDFADICTVMRNSGVAIMGSAIASGENRAVRAVEMSLNSPLLNDNNIIGARYVLLNIISGSDEITMDELGEITDFIQEAAGQTAEIIKGYGVDPSLGDSVSVTIIATGFQQTNPVNYEYTPKSHPEKVVRQLEEKIVDEAPKAEAPAPATDATVNPLEPFLVSKPAEPVAEVKPVETKTEWPSQNTVEFEIVNTSQEITEITNTVSVTNDETISEISAEVESNQVEEIPEPVLIVKEEVQPVVDPVEAAKKAEQEEIQRRANERIQKLRDISMKLKSPQVLNEMENEPAYKRRNVNLENVPHSSESQVSRFTLTETDEKKIEIRPNNSFLHDNVD